MPNASLNSLPAWLDDSLAPNGRPVRENFREWFGASAMIDSAGQPIILSHGTATDFDFFTPSKGGAHGPGIYMEQLAIGAKSPYGDRAMDLVVRMAKPFYWHPSDESYDALVDGDLLNAVLGEDLAEHVVARMGSGDLDAYGTEVVDALRARGHDGIVIVPPWSSGPLAGDNVVIAWEPNQVKLARGNSGVFSESASISDRHSTPLLVPARRMRA